MPQLTRVIVADHTLPFVTAVYKSSCLKQDNTANKTERQPCTSVTNKVAECLSKNNLRYIQ